jgi:NAD(P)-dependent dehydrogenase (short-subunit alcohol dehydrogenase family)
MRLKDKVAIITGFAHGMGEAEARLFAAEGAKVVVADILAKDAEAVVADIRAGGGEATAAKIDVTSEAEWAGLIAKTLATYGRLDILVNNAGISGSSVGDPDGLDGLGPDHRGQPDERLSRHQARGRADGQDRRRVDRQHQLYHGVCRRHRRSSGLSRLEGCGADLFEGRRSALRAVGGAGQHRASGLHAADAERHQCRRAR